MRKDKTAYNEYMKDYMAERYRKRRAHYLEVLGGKCAICGSDHGLEIDHKIAADKSFDVGKALASMATAKLEAELTKCQLLCYDCHQKKSINDAGNRRWKHGTLSGYRWCKCPQCKEAKANYMRTYKRPRRCGSKVDRLASNEFHAGSSPVSCSSFNAPLA